MWTTVTAAPNPARCEGRKMFDVFLSYASEDRGRAAALFDLLSREIGLSVFFDRASIPVGRDWREWIDEHLRTAKSIVVLWSRHSVRSTWVNYEARAGLHRGVLLPAIIEPQGVSIPDQFKHLQTADLSVCDFRSTHDDLENFLSSLGNVIGRPLSVDRTLEAIVPRPENQITLVPKEWLEMHSAKLRILLCFLHQHTLTRDTIAGALDLSGNEVEQNLQLLERIGYIRRSEDPLTMVRSLIDEIIDDAGEKEALAKKGRPKDRSGDLYVLTEKGREYLDKSVLNP
jgi:DNA-binding MarR family transcriptional regulator